jgi:hypothetical protein
MLISLDPPATLALKDCGLKSAPNLRAAGEHFLHVSGGFIAWTARTRATCGFFTVSSCLP